MLKNYLITYVTSCENLKLIKVGVSNPDLAMLFIPLCGHGLISNSFSLIGSIQRVTSIFQAAIGMGYMSSCLSPNLAVALAVGPTIFIPLMNFGGFYQNAGSIPVWLDWMKYISLWDG